VSSVIYNVIKFNKGFKKMKDAKTYRIKGDFAEKAEEKRIDYITKNRKDITEAEIINACIFKGLKNLKDSEIEMYLELARTKKIK
jgi:hypothetical protein